MRHGELPVSEHDLASIPEDDPELALVLAPLRETCNGGEECEALCVCNGSSAQPEEEDGKYGDFRDDPSQGWLGP